ncbi:family 10 glycosylhydrolase [bacterium]|nr:family 10 glycosylhydrolase [candidate division CSSED10-310 bacterium]
MKRLVNLIVFLSLYSMMGSASEFQPIRAVQVFTLSSPDIAGLKAEFRQLKQAGFNTIILRVFKNPYDGKYRFLNETHPSGVYFLSQHEPVVADAVTPVVNVAHSLNMKVFAWITTRKSQWILSDRPDWDSTSIDLKTGSEIPGDHLDIFRNDVQLRLMSMFSELCITDIDGILFQDDLVSRQAQDLSTAVWRSFRGSPFHKGNLTDLFDLNTHTVRYRSDFYNWTRCKSKALAQVLKRFVTHIKTAKPDMLVGMNLYYEAVTRPHHGRQWLSQDLEDCLNIPLDYWAVMAYQRQISQELCISEHAVSKELRRASAYLTNDLLIPSSKILWKFQTQDWASKEIIPVSGWSEFLNGFFPDQYVLVPYRGIESTMPFIEYLDSLD